MSRDEHWFAAPEEGRAVRSQFPYPCYLHCIVLFLSPEGIREPVSCQQLCTQSWCDQLTPPRTASGQTAALRCLHRPNVAALRWRRVILIQVSLAASCRAAVGWLYLKFTPTEEAWINFYTQQHKHYCGIDLHAKAMYVCILDPNGTKLVHKNLPTTPEAFLRLIAPHKEDLVVGVECMFTWKCAKESSGKKSGDRGQEDRHRASPLGVCRSCRALYSPE